MRSLIVIAVLLAVAYAAPKRLAPVEPATGPVINDEYIVVFNERATDALVERHHQKLAAVFAQYNNTQLRVMHQYHIGSFRGYSAHLDDRTLEIVREELIVKYIDHNQVVTAYQESKCTDVQAEAPWGLARTSNRLLADAKKLDFQYSNSAQGEGVDVYIIDTGIYKDHNDFGGRVQYGFDAIKERGVDYEDFNGHGTHVAGTVMGNTYGIAKKATAIAVKVLSAGGSGSTAGVVSGIQYVAEQHNSNKKSVANMSLGGGASTVMNDAVEAATRKGVVFAVAAGNSFDDACRYSPASSPFVTTVAASNEDDEFAYFTNYGECAEIIAPGLDVTSAWIGSPNAENTISGTSMASPHVAGVMAAILGQGVFSPQELEDRLVELSSKGFIKDDKPGQENRLLFMGCDR